ncbi:MAG: hypothetical protein BWX66_01527 [Deltaproteobacteria bacterium ADurb.Bin058]|nr:MAG: hypothetical protein BWX66_01527 [Deltaproteobacteria bacterium ADurb.Bin058]
MAAAKATNTKASITFTLVASWSVFIRPATQEKTMPTRYRIVSGTAISVCDKGSGGVKIAPIINAKTTKYLPKANSFLWVTNPIKVRKKISRGS